MPISFRSHGFAMSLPTCRPIWIWRVPKRGVPRSMLACHLLSDEQQTRYNAFKEFVSLNVEPFAEVWDREQQIPRSVISLLGEAGHLGVTMPPAYGGGGLDT